MQWFNSTCENLASQSITVRLDGLPQESESCWKIEEILLALSGRVKALSVYLSNPVDEVTLFPRLHKAGIVADEELDVYETVRFSFIVPPFVGP